MHILITGNGKAGSWKIRGEQLGAAIGAEICPNAGKRDLADAGLVIVVKRTPDTVLQHLNDLGKPWIYDAVDFWPQPYGNTWERIEAINWLRGMLAHLMPVGVVFSTKQMQLDAAWRGASLYLPHHARPGTQRVTVRRNVRAVAYEGAEHYLGRWRGIVEDECQRRGWRFLINPESLSKADIGVALRDRCGWPATAWKSNVKLANLQATGLPAICSLERGYEETANGTEWWAMNDADISVAFDHFAGYEVRRDIYERQIACAPTLETVSTAYAAWLAGFSSCAATRSRAAVDSA